MWDQRQIDSNSNLCEAIASGDERVANLIFNDADVNVRDKSGNTPLHLAITKLKNMYIFAMLLNKKVDIYAKNHDNFTPLDLAIQNNKTEEASLLIKKGALVGQDLNSLLLPAIEKNNHTIVKMIIDHEVQDNPSVNLIIAFQKALSKRNSMMVEAIIPHCGFSKPSDLYITRNLVMSSDRRYKNCVKLLLKWNFTIHLDNHDEEFVYAAVEKGYLSIVEDLLECGIDVNMINTKTGLSLLTIACLYKHHDIVEILLEYNADVNEIISGKNERLNSQLCFRRNIREFKNLFALDDHRNNSIDVTCLHIAVFNSDSKMTDILLRYGAEITDNAEFFNLTCLAVQNGCEMIVGQFLNHGITVTDVNHHRKTLLDICLYYGSDKNTNRYYIVELLLEKGADIHLKTPRNKLVFKAIEKRNCRIARLFLDYDADVQYISPDGHTALHKAIKYRFNVNFIETLLKLNSPVNTENNDGRTPLLDACAIVSGDQSEIVEALLDYNADVNFVDCNLMTPLGIVCFNENLDANIVKAFLNKGANPNVMNKNGQTPLHHACQFWSIRKIQFLLEYGANIDAVDNHGWTPLFIACNQNEYGTIKLLLDHHANPNHTDLENLTPLHILVKQASVHLNFVHKTYHTVQLLIKHGANVNVLDGTNRTPLYHAVEKMIYHSTDDPDHFSSACINYEMIIKTLVSEGIKLRTAGLEINNHNSNMVFNPDDYIIIDDVKYAANDILQLNVVSDSNDNTIDGVSDDEDSIGDMRQLKAKCEQEIQKMKEENIGIDDLTFYDLLKENMYHLSNFLENDEIQQTLEEGGYDEKFPLYIDIVKNRLRDVKTRYELYVLKMFATEYFTLNINEQLPDECIDEVWNYLNIKELKMFIEAMKSLDV